LTEFAEKSQVNFVRNVRPRLQRLFPNKYKGKDGMQQLLRDVRYMKIAVDGKIPPVSDNDKENFRILIEKGKSKVSADFGTCSTGNILEKREIGMEPFPMTFDSGDEDDEVINSKTSTVQEQVNRPSSCTITKSAAEINAQYEALPTYLSSPPTMPVTNQYEASFHQYPYYLQPFPGNVNHFSPVSAYPHQIFPTQAMPPPSHVFSNFFHPAMALPSQPNSTDFAMIQEHNTEPDKKKTETSVVSFPNINENVVVEKSHQTLIELANVALQSHEEGKRP
jgi:hypothetical protein